MTSLMTDRRDRVRLGSPMRCLLLCMAAAVLPGCINVEANVPEKIEFGSGGSGGDGNSGGGGWSEQAGIIAGEIIGDGSGGTIFFAHDVLAVPGRAVPLRAQVQAYRPERPLSGLTVEFRHLDDQRLVGKARTNDDGVAELEFTPPGKGTYEFTARVTAVTDEENESLLDLPEALLLVAVRTPDEAFVVIDLDHTLTGSNFARVVLLDGGAPMADSVRVVQRIARSQSVIYLTHRPKDLTRTSRRWLRKHGYPAGPLLLSSIRDVVGSSRKYKSARLKEVRTSFPKLQVGIGDKLNDVLAYRDNEMHAIWIPPVDRDDSEELRARAEDVRDAPREGVDVVWDWREIERILFGDFHRSPDAFARDLRMRADRLDRQREDDEDEEEDDD